MSDQDTTRRPLRARPTLKTIARLSGLAVTTVSRALNEAPDISDATKARVRAIARDIGYRPDRAALRLRTGRTQVISLVLSTDHEFMNHTVKLISSVAAGLRGTGYHLIVTPYFPREDPMAPIRYLVDSVSADGGILNQIEPGDRLVPYTEEPKNFRALYAPIDVKGLVLAVQLHRQYAMNGDIVVIDRGRQDGVQVGHQFEVFRAGKEVRDPVTTAQTLVPDDILGTLFVVKTGESTSLALLTRATREIKSGDHFRNL